MALNRISIRRLGDKYPGVFHLVVSAVTFDHGLRKRLMPRAPDAERVKDILLAARAPHVFLLHVGQRQTLEDLAAIDRMKLVGANVVVGPAALHAEARRRRPGTGPKRTTGAEFG